MYIYVLYIYIYVDIYKYIYIHRTHHSVSIPCEPFHSAVCLQMFSVCVHFTESCYFSAHSTSSKLLRDTVCHVAVSVYVCEWVCVSRHTGHTLTVNSECHRSLQAIIWDVTPGCDHILYSHVILQKFVFLSKNSHIYYDKLSTKNCSFRYSLFWCVFVHWIPKEYIDKSYLKINVFLLVEVLVWKFIDFFPLHSSTCSSCLVSPVINWKTIQVKFNTFATKKNLMY